MNIVNKGCKQAETATVPLANIANSVYIIISEVVPYNVLKRRLGISERSIEFIKTFLALELR